MVRVIMCRFDAVLQHRRRFSIHPISILSKAELSSKAVLRYSYIRERQVIPAILKCSSVTASGNPFYHNSRSCLHHTRNFIPYDLGWIQAASIHSTSSITGNNKDKEKDDEPSSKVEESVKHIKQKLEEEKEKGLVVPPPKRSIWKRIQDEILHYYHGFRLLFVDTRICIDLVWRILNGKSLTRREQRQLIRTSSDLFRLVPFSVFIIVPFMELLLPVFLKFFPGMLPSTFQTKNEREDKMKAQLKVKLEMAKFLQKTLDEMAVESKGHSSEKAKEFSIFFKNIRKSGEEVSTKQIIEFSKLFEDEITLESLSRNQLQAICRVLEIPPIGTNTLLMYQLMWKLNALKSDDKTIESEGLDSLNFYELQSACKARGMRAVGVSEDRLRRQMEQWLQLSLHEKVPPSLLLLSRALYLPENLPTTAQLQATLQALPESAGTQTKAAIGELEGKVDHKTRLEIIKEEQRRIKEEREEEARQEMEKDLLEKEKQKKEEAKMEEEAKKEELEQPEEAIISTVPLAMKPKKMEKAVLSMEETANEKDEIRELKEELAEYQEDIEEMTALKTEGTDKVDIHESKGAKRLYKRVNQMVSNLDNLVNKLPPSDKPSEETKKEEVQK